MMAKTSIFIVIFVLLSFLLGPLALAESEYVGAAQCMTCHPKEYDDWKDSGHAHILNKSSSADIGNIPFPAGFGQADISYVIGGHRWKALFLDRSGYLITSTQSGQGKNQYNLNSKRWVDYLPGEKVPYDCGRCHTTGFSPQGHQDGLEGIVGTWKFESIECEACHGPGALHASSSLKTDIKVDKNNCPQCHGTSPPDAIPVDGVFLAPYTEANQLMKSKMRNLACLDCHNPHRSAQKSVKRTCESCHEKTSSQYRESYMFKVGVKCADCHMPPAAIVAEGDNRTFRGDFKSHLFKIDHRKELPILIVGGKKINPGYLSVDYTCTRCHSIYENRQWAASFGLFAHRIKITTDIKIMRLQIAAASLGVLFSLAALLSAAFLKNWFWPVQNKKKMISIHKHTAWITFSLYAFVSTLCIYFHFPLDNPAKAFTLGWFLIHIINGPLGLLIYAGKVVIVRKYKKGWASQGVLWGAALFAFWLVQYGTAVFAFFNISRL